MSVWSLVVATPDDEDGRSEIYIFPDEAEMYRTIKEIYDPIGKCPAGRELVGWLEADCDYRVWIAEHEHVELRRW